MSVTDNNRNMKRVMRDLRALQKTGGVVAGITHAAGGDVLKYASANEFGTKNRRIPSRPFMRNYYDQNQGKIERFAVRQITALIVDGKGTADSALTAVGLMMQNGIKREITTAIKWAVPNAPATVYNKLMRNRAAVGRYVGMKLHSRAEHHKVSAILAPTGPSGTKPLIDSGVMLSSVTMELRKK